MSHDTLRKLVIKRREAIKDSMRPEAVFYQHSRGKLTARERISSLVDKESFIEFGGLALPGDKEHQSPGYADALVTGWASVEGSPVVVMAADFTVNGGSNGEVGLEKMRVSYERAMNSGVPVIQLLEGVGHRISEGLDARLFAPGFPELGYQAQLSGWVPMPTAILGQGFAAMTLIASVSDFVVVVRGVSTMGMAPSPLVKAAIGEDVKAEELGGAEVQANGNGQADVIVDTELEAIEVIQRYLSYFPANASELPPRVSGRPPEEKYASSLPELIPTDFRYAYDIRDAILGIVDNGSLMELKAGYARNIVCSLARIGGRSVGIVANQPNFMAGSLDSPACEKASHFIGLCDAFGIPLIFLLDLPGFMVGSEAEKSKLARRSARLIFEISQVTVPTYNIVLRKAYGGAYIAMNGGRSFGAEMTLAWPTAEFAAMNVETAVSVAYRKELNAADDSTLRHEEICKDVRSRLGPLRAAEGFGVDAVILPEETRGVLERSLGVVPARKQFSKITGKVRAISPI